MPLLCLPIPDFSRANLCLVCPVIWHSRWELVQICWENFSQPLLAILYRLLAPCNASVSHPPPKKKRHGGKKLKCNWGRGIGWDIDSLQSGEIVHPITKHCAAQCARHCNFFVCSWLIRPLEPGWELSFNLWICKFYPNLDAKKSEGEIAHQIIKHCRHCMDSFHCTKHKSICQWLVWFGHCIYGFQTKKKLCAQSLGLHLRIGKMSALDLWHLLLLLLLDNCHWSMVVPSLKKKKSHLPINWGDQGGKISEDTERRECFAESTHI